MCSISVFEHLHCLLSKQCSAVEKPTNIEIINFQKK